MGERRETYLPAKDIIGVLAVAVVVTSGEIEGLLDTLGPGRLVVELGGVPDDLEHQLRDTDGVGGWAVAAEAEEGGGPVDGVGDVVLVVGGIEVLAIPASNGVSPRQEKKKQKKSR
jgi:hypothetical protein